MEARVTDQETATVINLGTTMTQYSGLKRTGTLKRSPLRRVSKKRAKENRLYNVLRTEYLQLHTNCKVCENQGHVPVRKATEIHHMNKRFGSRLNDMTMWLPVCHACHMAIEADKKNAREVGYLMDI